MHIALHTGFFSDGVEKRGCGGDRRCTFFDRVTIGKWSTKAIAELKEVDLDRNGRLICLWILFYAPFLVLECYKDRFTSIGIFLLTIFRLSDTLLFFIT